MPPERHTRACDSQAAAAGTYHYWASTIGAPVPFRELAGALVVDPPDGPAEPDRILVITEWTSLTSRQLGQIVTADVPAEVFVGFKPRLTFVINGLSWPATERFDLRARAILSGGVSSTSARSRTRCIFTASTSR